MDHAEDSKRNEEGSIGIKGEKPAIPPSAALGDPPPAPAQQPIAPASDCIPGIRPTTSTSSSSTGRNQRVRQSGTTLRVKPVAAPVRKRSPAVVSRGSGSSASHLASAPTRPHLQSTSSEEEESEAELDDEEERHSRLRSSQIPVRPVIKRKGQTSDLGGNVSAEKPSPDGGSLAKSDMKMASKLSSPAAAAVAAALGALGSDHAASTWDPLETKPAHKPLHTTTAPPAPPSTTTTRTYRRHRHHHLPNALPTFREPRASMWTSTHDANSPSEDRFSSLVNILLRPPPSKMGNTENISSSGSSGSGSDDDLTQMDEATQVDPRPHPYEEDNTSLIRVSLWSVIDGHGGGCVATYASEVLLPHIAASVARALKCTIVDRGVFHVNGQLRDANALDLDGLIRSSDRSKTDGDAVNPNSIHYKSPSEIYDSESEGEAVDHTTSEDGGEQLDSTAPIDLEPPISVASSLRPRTPPPESVSSVKTSVKTAVSPVTRHAPVGTHSASEVAEITKAITHSFLSVDEGWINSIDPITTHQTSCISNGRWNAGACALVVFTIQRLDWTRSSTADPEIEIEGQGAGGGEDTSHNKDAARRRKLDYATKSKSVSSLSTLSSTSSLATVGPPTAVSVQESEITETEDDDDVSDIFGPRRRGRRQGARDDPHHTGDAVISTPGGCKCHFYRPHDAMLYTAHVGDCRAVMLGSAPPRTIKVRPEGEAADTDHVDSSDDYSSCDTSSGESEGMSSSDSDSSGVEEEEDVVDRGGTASAATGTGTYMAYMRRPSKKQCRRGHSDGENSDDTSAHPPFVPLASLHRSGSSSSEESEAESDDSTITTVEPGPGPERKKSRRNPRDLTRIAQKITQEPAEPSPFHPPLLPPPLPLSPMMRPIDLTTDHSAYNPAEVTAVLRRCNNAPRAISAASGGGIKRVAGSLAVTRALGDAYLKTPRLSFFPYKRHAPYITARPEVNCRLLSKGGDRVLILATDGVWERCSGDDVLRWVRNYYNERIAGVEKHHFHHRRLRRTHRRGHHHHHHHSSDKDGETMVENGLGSSSSRSSTASEASDISGKTSSIERKASDSEGKTSDCEGKTSDCEGKTSDCEGKTSDCEGKTSDSDGNREDERSAGAGKSSEGSVSGHKRKRGSSVSTTTHSSSGSSRGEQRRTRSSGSVHNDQVVTVSTVSDVIVRRVLNKVRRARNMSSLRSLMELPRGRARRSKHDDITASVIDMSGFVS